MDDKRSDRANGPRGSKRPGVRAIAKATGLSVATVSRVLNDATNVRADTRARVTAAMRDLGFRPNPAARALSTNRTRTIGAVVPTLSHSIFTRFLDGAEQELARHGYALVLATAELGRAQEFQRVKEIMNLGVEGLIVSGATHDPGLLELISSQHLPTVCISIYQPEFELATIGYDNEDLAFRAMGFLRELGHRSIAVIHGPQEENDRTQLRVKGAKRGAKGLKPRFFETSLDVGGGVEATARMLTGGQRPTALLCVSDVLAMGALFELSRHGVKVPEDVSVMGFDDLDWAGVSTPPLTTIRLPTKSMGRRAAGALVENLDHNKPIPSELLDAEIVVRESTAPPPKGA